MSSTAVRMGSLRNHYAASWRAARSATCSGVSAPRRTGLPRWVCPDPSHTTWVPLVDIFKPLYWGSSNMHPSHPPHAHTHTCTHANAHGHMHAHRDFQSLNRNIQLCLLQSLFYVFYVYSIEVIQIICKFIFYKTHLLYTDKRKVPWHPHPATGPLLRNQCCQ